MPEHQEIVGCDRCSRLVVAMQIAQAMMVVVVRDIGERQRLSGWEQVVAVSS